MILCCCFFSTDFIYQVEEVLGEETDVKEHLFEVLKQYAAERDVDSLAEALPDILITEEHQQLIDSVRWVKRLHAHTQRHTYRSHTAVYFFCFEFERSALLTYHSFSITRDFSGLVGYKGQVNLQYQGRSTGCDKVLLHWWLWFPGHCYLRGPKAFCK